MKKIPIYCDWVRTLLKFNNELIDIVEQKAKLNDNMHWGERKLIDINNLNDNEPNVMIMIPLQSFIYLFFVQRNEYDYYFRMLFPAFFFCFFARMRDFEPKTVH